MEEPIYKLAKLKKDKDGRLDIVHSITLTEVEMIKIMVIIDKHRGNFNRPVSEEEAHNLYKKLIQLT